MKNHKGAVPALLTLGLVLVGSLITIGISFLTNNNKISSNPRAAGCSNKTFCAEGKINNDGSGTNYFWTRDGDFFSDQDCGTMMIASQVCTLSDTSVDDDSSEGTLNKSCRSSAPYCNQGLICNSSTICVEDNSCGKLGGNCINGCPSDRLIDDSQATNYCVQSFASGFSCCKPYSGGSGDDDDNPPTSSNGVPYPKKACCFKKEGQDPVVYATALARVNNEMSTPCTTEAYNNAYNAEWGYCNDDGSGYGGSGGSGGGRSNQCEDASPNNSCVPSTTLFTDTQKATDFCKSKGFANWENWYCGDDKHVCCSSSSGSGSGTIPSCGTAEAQGQTNPNICCNPTTCKSYYNNDDFTDTAISYYKISATSIRYYKIGTCNGSYNVSSSELYNYCTQMAGQQGNPSATAPDCFEAGNCKNIFGSTASDAPVYTNGIPDTSTGQVKYFMNRICDKPATQNSCSTTVVDATDDGTVSSGGEALQSNCTMERVPNMDYQVDTSDPNGGCYFFLLNDCPPLADGINCVSTPRQ